MATMTSSTNQGYAVVSPGGQGYGDNNYYASPAVSPGNWNVVSPNSSVYSSQAASVHSHTSAVNPAASPGSTYSRSSESIPTGTPSSVSSRSSHSTAGSAARSPLSLPAKLGKKHQKIEKASLDVRREKVASAKALALMQENFGACSDMPGPSVSAGQAATMQSNARVLPTRREKMATTTRKKKQPTAEEDFETINDFKDVWDLEQQTRAERRAVSLIRRSMPGFV